MFGSIYIYLFKIRLFFKYKIIIWKKKKIQNIKFESFRLILNRVFILTFEKFPDHSISEKRSLASIVTKVLLSFDKLENNTTNEFRELYELSLEDIYIKKRISSYYLLSAYYYSGYNSKKNQDLIVSDILTAKKINPKSIHLTRISFLELSRDYKKEFKEIKKEIKVLISDKVKNDKLKLISPIDIDISMFPMILAMFTTLFLLGGFVYVKSLFYWFGINVGDFYTIQDYVSSSIDVISATAMTVFIGIVSMAFGLSSAIDENIYDEHVGRKRKRNFIWPIIVISSLVGGALSFYQIGRIPSLYFYPISFILAFYLSFDAPFWKYIKNRNSIGIIFFISLVFFINLGFVVKDKIENIVFDENKKNYEINFFEGYEGLESMSYFTGNSNFIFLMSDSKDDIMVFPRRSIKQIKIKR